MDDSNHISLGLCQDKNLTGQRSRIVGRPSEATEKG